MFCLASLMFRVVESAEHILERVRIIAKESGVQVHVLGLNEPVILTSKHSAKLFKSSVQKIRDYDVEIPSFASIYSTYLEPPKPYESYTVAFNTDVSLYKLSNVHKELQIPYYKRKSELKGVYLFGGGSITNAHGADEHILIKDLESAVDVHVDLVIKLLTNHA
jgi:acetylornithine deacetylase/succinyl-diaminopimelate desuccinylase-like protein